MPSLRFVTVVVGSEGFVKVPFPLITVHVPISELSIDYGELHTNMVFVNCPENHRALLEKFLFDRGIIVTNLDRGRLVCHLGIEEKDILNVINAFKEYFK